MNKYEKGQRNKADRERRMELYRAGFEDAMRKRNADATKNKHSAYRMGFADGSKI